MHLTAKQIELINVIGKRNEDGGAIDLDQLLERLSYRTSKQSIQFSIRALIKHGLIEKSASEKRRGRTRTLLSLTELGEQMVGVRRPVSFVVPLGEEDVLEELSEVLEDI